MKRQKLVLSFVFLFMSTLLTMGQSSAELFRQANELREKGKNIEAISLYKRVKLMDSEYASDCDYWIKRIEALPDVKKKSTFAVSASSLNIPYQGGIYEIWISNAVDWSASCNAEWLNIKCKDDLLIVECANINPSTKIRSAIIEVKCGADTKNVSICNEGAPEFLFASSNIVNFTSKGGVESILIESNGNWIVSSKPSWCVTEVEGNKLKITIDDNTDSEGRKGIVRVSSTSNLSTDINVRQLPRQQFLELSKDNLRFSMSGGIDTIKVYSNDKQWHIADFPYWCNARQISDSSIVIVCAANDPIDQKREGGVKILFDDKHGLINIYQDPAPKPQYIPIAKVVKGRDVSFGIVAAYAVPVVAAKSSSDFTASAINYSLGDQREQVDYKSSGGYTVGAYADIRLYKNLFLVAGVNFTDYSYTNLFDEKYTQKIVWGRDIMEGVTDNRFEEKYHFNWIEIPVKVSYRFPLNTLSFLSVNAGPILSCGIKANMTLNGNSVSPYMNYVDKVGGIEGWIYSCDGYMNLYSSDAYYTKTYTGEDLSSVPIESDPMISSAPYNRITLGGSIGFAYEYRGIALELEYCHMFNNMANAKYWDSERFEIFTFGSDVLMSGYKQRNHRLQLKLSYTLRYKK